MNKNESKYFNTAKKMNDALIALLDKKDFTFITVKDICDEACVNRSTFYLHYQNTSDLLDEVIYNLNKSFHEHFNKQKSPDLNTNDVSDLILIKDDYLLPYLSFIKDNRKIYKAVKAFPKLFAIDKYSKAVYNDLISKILDRFNVDIKYKSYMFDFYINGITAIVLSWCDNDCDLEVEEISSLIKGIILNDRKNQG